MESAMKAALMFSTLVACILFAAPAGALTGGPSQWGPSYPYPSYCQSCGARGYVVHHRHAPARHDGTHRHRSGADPK
jgi:hypothetical protein